MLPRVGPWISLPGLRNVVPGARCPSATGRTYLVIGLAMRACQSRHGVCSPRSESSACPRSTMADGCNKKVMRRLSPAARVARRDDIRN